MKIKPMDKEDFTTKSFWLTTRDYTPNQPLEGNIEVDVAVIGGGFTGLTTSHFLKQAEAGMKVAILESQVIGFGASGRNAGFSMTKFGMEHFVTAMRFGKQRAVEAHDYNCRAVDLQKELIETLNLDCDYEHPGFIWLATCPTHSKRLEHAYEYVTQKLGIKEIYWIDEKELKERVNSPTYHGGAWWEPRTGILNPAKLAWSWKHVVESEGVEVYENTPATEIVREGGGFRIETPNGQVLARKILLATNAWSHLFKQAKHKQVPLWTYIVLTEPLTEKQFDAIGWRGREGLEDARNLIHYYRLTADNRILFGGRDIDLHSRRSVPKEKDYNPVYFDRLKEDLVKTFPPLKGIKFTHQWGGPVSVTLDLAPAMGYAGGKDVVYSVGCTGHAVSMTHLNGQTLADLLLERDTELTQAFFVNRRTIPFPPGPLAAGAMRMITGLMDWDDKRALKGYE